MTLKITQKKYFLRKRSSIPPSKGSTVKFLRYVAIFTVFFLSKCAEMRLIIRLLHFLSEAASVLRKYIFQYIYLDLLRPLQCRTQSFFGHTGTCTGTGTLTEVLESAPSDRQTNKSYGSI